MHYDEWNYTVRSVAPDDDGVMRQRLRIVGTVAMFGDTLLSDTSRVRMASKGTLAGLRFHQVRERDAARGPKLPDP